MIHKDEIIKALLLVTALLGGRYLLRILPPAAQAVVSIGASIMVILYYAWKIKKKRKLNYLDLTIIILVLLNIAVHIYDWSIGIDKKRPTTLDAEIQTIITEIL